MFVATTLGLSSLQGLVAGVAFAVHPVHTEAVCSIVSRADLLATAALIGALLFYCGAVRTLLLGGSARSGWSGMVLAYGLAFLGTFAKESGLMIAPLLFLVDLLLLPVVVPQSQVTVEQPTNTKGSRTPGRSPVPSTPTSNGRARAGSAAAATPSDRTPVARRTPGTQTKELVPEPVAASFEDEQPTALPARVVSWLKAVPAGIRDLLVQGGQTTADSGEQGMVAWALAQRSVRLMLALLLTFGLLSLRLAANRGAPLYRWSIFENQMAVMPQGLARTLTLAQSHYWAVKLLLWPRDLAYVHGFAQLMPVESLADPAAWAGVATWAALVGLGLVLVAQRSRLLLWCLGACIASYLPASNLLVWVGTEVAERLLYTPSVFLVLGLVAAWPGKVVKDAPRSSVGHLAFLCVGLLSCCWWSSLRAGDWRDELSLFSRGYAVSPRDMRAANNLAMALLGSPSASGEERAAKRARAARLLETAVADQPSFQYLAAANRAAIAWSDRDLATALKYSWIAVEASNTAGVSDRLPCTTASTLASVYLSLAQEYGSHNLEGDTPWAAEAGGVAQASWRRAVHNSVASDIEAAGPGAHVSPAGLAKVASTVAMDSGCWSPELLHVTGSAVLILGQETGQGIPGVVLPPATNPGPGPALFEFLQSLAAAGLGVRSVLPHGQELSILAAPELPAPSSEDPVLAQSTDYVPPYEAPLPPTTVIAQVVAMPRRGRGGVVLGDGRVTHSTSAPLQEPSLDQAGLVPGSAFATREQTGSTLNQMSTASRALAEAVSGNNPQASRNLVALADGLGRLAIMMQPGHAAFRTNLAVVWASHAADLAQASGTSDPSPYFLAAAEEAREALRLATEQGREGQGLAPFHSNVGFVLERQAGATTDPSAQLSLLKSARDAYVTAASLAPSHGVIQSNAARLQDMVRER